MSQSARESTETSLPSFPNTLSPRSSFSPDMIAVMSREGKTRFPDACRTVADGLLPAFEIVRAWRWGVKVTFEACALPVVTCEHSASLVRWRTATLLAVQRISGTKADVGFEGGMQLSNFLLRDPERVESKRPCQQAQDYLNRNLFTLKNFDFSHAEHWAIRPCGYRHLKLADLVSYNSQSLKHVKVLSRETRWTMNQDCIKILMKWSKRKLVSNLTKIVIYNTWAVAGLTLVSASIYSARLSDRCGTDQRQPDRLKIAIPRFMPPR